MKTINIGITGLKETGKTIFITSLINHLLEGNGSTLECFEDNQVDFFGETGIIKSKFRKFPYKKYIYDFTKDIPDWPKKTVDIFDYCINLKLKENNKTKEVKLIITDYPGERLLDMPMLRNDFARWSDNIIEDAELGVKNELSKDWFLSLENVLDNADKAALATKEYKKYIKKCIDNNLTHIQPAIMVFEAEGINVKEAKLFDMNFCPLSREIREKHPTLTRMFEKTYNKYVSGYVKPFEKNVIKKNNVQVVLVDVLNALTGGVDCYNELRKCIKDAIDSYGYFKKGFLRGIMQWISPNIDKVLFVATKADQCSENSRENLRCLLRDIVRKSYDKLRFDLLKKNISFKFCAAHRCTEDIIKDVEGFEVEALRGLIEENGIKKEAARKAGVVPAKWLEDWDSNKYKFDKFLPRKLSKREGDVIEHINLDKVIFSIISEVKNGE